MKDLYIVKTRYEYRGTGGVVWTSWFVLDSEYRTKNSAEEFIKTTKKLYNDVDKRTKLKHEYIIVPVEEYERELADVDKLINEAKARDDKYYESDKWKELKHKKYVARKERKQKQQEYLEMQKQLENSNK